VPYLITIKQSLNQLPLFGYALLLLIVISFSQTLHAKSKDSTQALSFIDYLHINYQSHTYKKNNTFPAIPSYKIIETKKVSLTTPIVTILGAPPPPARPIVNILPTVKILGEPSPSIATKKTKKSTQLIPLTSSTLTWKTKNNSQNKKQFSSKESSTHPQPKIAIIIDDLGNNKQLDTRMAQLPGSITLAILPHTPHSKKIAQLGFGKQKEIMLHAPMESVNGRKLGDGALTEALSEQEFFDTIQGNIDSIPHISGLNNHMGSSLTQNRQAMHWVMQSIVKNKLFFVDSRTTTKSIAAELASQYHIDNISRQVFLDNETNREYIDKAFKKAIAISKKTGFALVIGHPYPATVEYLENNLQELERQGVTLVSVSELLYARAEKKRNTLDKNSPKEELAEK
jgi:polysaccharide deacetylase 2 family uncharacterized protein YibQ